MKSGYLYVLVHPSDPKLIKVGITTRNPEHRLAEHNQNYGEYAGQIVKATGQKWQLKEYHAVPDPVWAESVFWSATEFADIPYRRGIEIERMDWSSVESALDAAKNAGIRPGPPPLPDYVYVNTASIRKRLEGRGITLISHVPSLHGKANFRCSNGHEWRTTPLHVGEGQGCPECGIGERDPEDIRRRIGAGVICLLAHPEMPGLVRIWSDNGTLEKLRSEKPWGDWEIHRYRNVDDVALAESELWDLLGVPPSHGREPLKKPLSEAEDAIRKLIYVMQETIAFEERRRDAMSQAEQNEKGQCP